MDLDITKIVIGGVGLTYLLPRLIEFFKVLGLKGQAAIWGLVFGLGVSFAGIASAIEQGLIPSSALPWINVAIWALVGGVATCAAIGDYTLGHPKEPEPAEMHVYAQPRPR